MVKHLAGTGRRRHFELFGTKVCRTNLFASLTWQETTPYNTCSLLVSNYGIMLPLKAPQRTIVSPPFLANLSISVKAHPPVYFKQHKLSNSCPHSRPCLIIVISTARTCAMGKILHVTLVCPFVCPLVCPLYAPPFSSMIFVGRTRIAINNSSITKE